MLAVAVPTAPLAPAAIVAGAKVALNKTLRAAGSGHYTLTNCRRTGLHYGACHFDMKFKSTSSGKTFRCIGRMNVRSIGNGIETSYGVVACNGKRVN